LILRNSKERVNSVYFATEIKRTNKAKQYVTSESTQATKKRKRESNVTDYFTSVPKTWQAI